MVKLKTIPLLLLSVIPLGCDRHHNRETKYLNNQIEEQFSAIETKEGDFVKDGDYKKWFPDGAPQVESHYSDNLLDGEYHEWYSNGKKSAEGSYGLGKKKGEWKLWFDNGQLRSVDNFNLNGKKDGVSKSWTRNGRRITDRIYSGGKDVNLPATYTNGKYGSITLNSNSTYSFTYKESLLKRLGRDKILTTVGSFEMKDELLTLDNFGYLQLGCFVKDTLRITFLPSDIIYLRDTK
jgi:hypothetical protein